MHGHRRDEYKARMENPKVAAGLAQKAQQWNTLSQELIQRRRRKETPLVLDEEAQAKQNTETLALTEKLLLVNPDPLELWNHRRELLLNDVVDLNTELVLTASCLKRNPKAYGAWFHRKWIIREDFRVQSDRSVSSSVALLEQELALCAQFLKLDERNFHCWNYRRFVVAVLMAVCQEDSSRTDGSWVFGHDVVMGAQLTAPQTDRTGNEPLNASVMALLESEWAFTTEKIQQNFSNFSAFHYRSKLLPLRLQEDETRMSLARTEIEIIHNAIFTEPDDQTAWWYHRFILMEWLDPSETSGGYEALLVEERDLLVELIETEEGQCKWGLMALHMVLTQMKQPENQDEGKISECLERLTDLDPDRAARYESMKKMHAEAHF